MSPRSPGHALDVLFLASRTPPSVGGRESVLRELLRHQPPATSRLVAPRVPGPGSWDRTAGLEIRRFPQWPFLGNEANRWIRSRHLRWVMRQRTPDLLVAFGLGEEAGIAREAKRTGNTPYALHVDAPEMFEARRTLRAGGEPARALQDLLDEAEAIVVASRACRLETYKAGVYPHRIEVVPPGVDPERFCPGPKPEALLRRLELGRGPVLLTVTGRGPGKDPDTLFRALAGLQGGKGGATLVVVGPLDASWRSAAEQARVKKSVRFTGVVPDAELPDHYRIADLFVHAHREDREAGTIPGTEVAFAEALASGLPVVATAVPAVEGMLVPDETALLVEPGAHTKLARAVTDLLASDERRTELSEAARAHAVAEHSAPANAARFRELLEVIWFRRLGRGRLDRAEEPAAAAERSAA